MKGSADTLFIIRHADRDEFGGHFTAFGFMEEDHYVMTVPSLGISGYGDNEEEAKEMLKEVMDDFAHGLLSLPQKKAIQELMNRGWHRNQLVKNRFINTSKFRGKEAIRDFYNLAPGTTIQEVALSI